MRILVVEDEPKLAKLMASSLEAEGFTADVVLTNEDAKHLLASISYDALVLDLGLPDRDGLELIRELRASKESLPILVATARDALSSRLQGLEIGADDYIVKPFDLREMNARVKALLRRPGGLLGNVLSTGNVAFDIAMRSVSVGGKGLTMPRRELSILELLMRGAGRVVPKQVIEDKIYGIDDEPVSNPVPVHIHHLRARLTDAGATIEVHTVRGIGYVLMEKK